jgi:hypothetical protein
MCYYLDTMKLFDTGPADMSRRDFLKITAASSTAAMTGVAAPVQLLHQAAIPPYAQIVTKITGIMTNSSLGELLRNLLITHLLKSKN